jgi:hypothetical protein
VKEEQSKEAEITAKTKLSEPFRTQWIEALRSGKYQQASGSLMKVEDGTIGYCCLGVACKIVGIADNHLHGYGSTANLSSDVNQVLPRMLRYEVDGIEGDAIDFRGECIDMNDNKRYSFAQIADWLEQNTEGE